MTESVGLVQIPRSEAWLHEPGFNERLQAGAQWMGKYLAVYSGQDIQGRLLLSMNFKCDMALHDDHSVDAATHSIKALWTQGWSLLNDGCAVGYSELQSLPGYYLFQLSDSIRAVVAKFEDKMFFLALDSPFLEKYFKNQREQLNLKALAREHSGD